jgi:hypothetical protein
MKKVVKAGKLANGFELGKGKIVHLVDSDKEIDLYCRDSLCGERPAISWTEVDCEVTCSKCLRKLKILQEGKPMKTKLIGSAASLEKLIELIKQHYYWAIVSTIEIKPNIYKVYSGAKEMEGLLIKHKKNRWRLEMEITDEN